MLLPSVLPCENAFRVSRSRTTTRSQTQRNGVTSLIPSHPTLSASAIGLGLSISQANVQLTPRSERIATSSEALHHLLSLDQTPPPHFSLSKSRYSHSLLATPTPSRTPSPQTPSKQLIPHHTPWTTPGDESSGEEMEVDTPRASTSGNTYTYTIVTRNNKRKRNASASSADAPVDLTPRHLHPFTTPDPMGTPTVCPPAPKIESSTFHPETDDELLDDPFVTPKRTRLRGPASKRLSTARRNLGPWSEEEDKQLVGMVLAKMRLSERDWAECATTLGRDGMSVGERWRGLVEAGSVGLINERRKEEKMKRARMQGNGRGQLEPVRRSGRASKGIKRR
ncbi:hypothetical protein H072_3454 [Dactylellina haptotyla CBS 200.50]|uniref:Myb-like domain-containing protein n=1 Tax=Dactylellina haptotyla (strain CBS 200.50) TaxID=1284197 RepID=S8ANE0_DACHA|nr:hypothetical protein H072_3454 [Dactylellina haptotyla CBS 200.50]